MSCTSGRAKCSRCGDYMLEIQPCHFICHSCGGIHDCADNAGSNGEA